MKIRAVEDQGSSQEEDIARVRFQRKQGPTQERSTTVPIAPVSNTEGMEEVKKTLRDIQDDLNKPTATRACGPRRRIWGARKKIADVGEELGGDQEDH